MAGALRKVLLLRRVDLDLRRLEVRREVGALMPPSVRIESKAWDDPAFAILANRLGMPDPDLALIKCGRIWAYCTEHNDPKVSVELVDAITRTPSFASAMVFAKLATFCDENAAVLVAGATGKNRNRIAWLATKRKNARKGGNAKAAKGLPIGKPKACHKPAESLPSYSGSGSAPVPSPALPGEGASPPTAPVAQGTFKLVPPAPTAPDPHKVTLDGYHQLHLKASGGQKYAWTKKAIGQIAELLERANGDPGEVLRRAGALLESPPGRFTRDGLIPDLGALLVHWDQIAPGKARASPFVVRGHAPPSDASEFGDGDVNKRGGT